METEQIETANSATGQWSVYEMNDIDWVVARTLEEAREFYEGETGCDSDDMEDAKVVSPDELGRLTYRDDIDMDTQEDWLHPERWVCECGKVGDGSGDFRWAGGWFEHHHGYPVGHVPMKRRFSRSFAEQLRAVVQGGIAEPQMFATRFE